MGTEASFLYEDTPDQGKATTAIKADMESERPMDRLVCGDVGFGKTESPYGLHSKQLITASKLLLWFPPSCHFNTLRP